MTESRSSELLQLVHSDVCGPFGKKSLGGSRYFLTFIDDKSRRIFVYFLKGKDEVFGKFLEFKSLVERQKGKKLKCIRSDNGREYVNKAFDDYLKKNGILRQLTIAYTPQQNGVAERANRTLVEMSRFALSKGHQESKFRPKGKEYRMVGYSSEAKGYRLYDGETRKVVEQRDVLFDERDPLEQTNCTTVMFDLPGRYRQNEIADANPEINESESDISEGQSAESDADEELFHSAPEEKVAQDESEIRVGPGSIGAGEVPIPSTYEDAISGPYRSQWQEAMDKEFGALGDIERFKARLVAKGCSQQFGVNYTDTYAPVCRLESVRFVLAVASELDLYLHQMDVCTAYLNSDLEGTVYMRQPMGYTDKNRPKAVLHLKKAIYDLRLLLLTHQVACDNEQCKRVDIGSYQTQIGELMWLALTTRPDILHSVAKLAQRSQDPHSEHEAGVKHILRYLASTMNKKLPYKRTGQPFSGYVDADWGGDKTDRKSYTGYIFFLAGGPISWKSEKQRSVA
ncbi:uncharacterized protein LOC124461204 [Drosophila willistoni]|uniref:uncharacterized protein LOC124461204 n=1 Tax=Drosophila willistoni TaxID=7260 RepID=UPI001F07E79E|nr:uncharacterized protein LOC124461204 [Drosophila willistoni]